MFDCVRHRTRAFPQRSLCSFAGIMRQLQAGYTNHRWTQHVLSKRVAVLVASRGRPDLVERTISSIRARSRGRVDILVAECGTAPEKRSPHATVYYDDPENEKGKTYCHDLAYKRAQARGGEHAADEPPTRGSRLEPEGCTYRSPKNPR